MTPSRWLRFKIVTSFAIAALGMVTCIRLANLQPVSADTLVWFIAPLVFVGAGLWRGMIFMRALRGVKS
jgi:hypothetical protein